MKFDYIHIRLPEEVRHKLQIIAVLEDKSLTTLINELVNEFLEKKKITM